MPMERVHFKCDCNDGSILDGVGDPNIVYIWFEQTLWFKTYL